MRLIGYRDITKNCQEITNNEIWLAISVKLPYLCGGFGTFEEYLKE